MCCEESRRASAQNFKSYYSTSWTQHGILTARISYSQSTSPPEDIPPTNQESCPTRTLHRPSCPLGQGENLVGGVEHICSDPYAKIFCRLMGRLGVWVNPLTNKMACIHSFMAFGFSFGKINQFLYSLTFLVLNMVLCCCITLKAREELLLNCEFTKILHWSGR
jgi:hypothetical protein